MKSSRAGYDSSHQGSCRFPVHRMWFPSLRGRCLCEIYGRVTKGLTREVAYGRWHKLPTRVINGVRAPPPPGGPIGNSCLLKLPGMGVCLLTRPGIGG